jgi:hypothetical protein
MRSTQTEPASGGAAFPLRSMAVNPTNIYYTGDGTTTDYAFPFAYLSASHVFVTVDGVDTPYTLLSANTVRITPAPASGLTVRVYRDTPRTPIITWADGAVILGKDMNAANTQNIYICEEAFNYATSLLEEAKQYTSEKLVATSATSLTIESGAKAFTTQADKLFAVGAFIFAASAASPTTHWMSGQVTGYSGTTLNVDITRFEGSGARADWNIYVSGAVGGVGNVGPQGAQGPQGIQGIAGPQGLVWKDAWTTATGYSVRDGVSRGGSSFICKTAHTSDAASEPEVGANWTTYWNYLAQRGDTGPAGAGSGDVLGPASATDSHLAEFSGGTGKVIKDGGVAVSAFIKTLLDDIDAATALSTLGAAAVSHGHAIADVASLQAALDGKSATGHGHAIADVTGLQTALDGKSATGHGHVITDVTGLQTALDGKEAADANIIKANVTKALTAGYTSASLDKGSIASGTFTPDLAERALQHFTLTGAISIAPPTADGSVIVDQINGTGAGTVTRTGFTKVTGDTLTTTVGNVFRHFITKGSGGSHCHTQALQ